MSGRHCPNSSYLHFNAISHIMTAGYYQLGISLVLLSFIYVNYESEAVIFNPAYIRHGFLK